MKEFCLSLILAAALLNGADEAPSVHKSQVTYLMQSQNYRSAIDLYQKYAQENKRHDFEVLEQIATIVLEQSAHSSDLERRLLSIFGLGLAGISSSVNIVNILETGIRTPHLETQLISIQFLGQLQDDRSDELLTRAMSSDFLMARMEAAYHLAERKTRSATGQIESLMHKLPLPFRFYFTEFFAQIGTLEAINVLRHMIDDPDALVRISSILNAAFYGRDDLIAKIRMHASRPHAGEQEASMAALGILKDSHSVPLLKKQVKNGSSLNVRLAALRSLSKLGEKEAQEQLIELAKSHNLFAISLLSEISNSEETLAELVKEENIQIRLNAALSLLKHKDPRSMPALLEILIRDTSDLGFQPQFSPGASLTTIKVIPSARQHQKEGPYDLAAATLGFREQVLRECLELPEETFLMLAQVIFHSQQTELIPQLIQLLQNLQTSGAISLLKEQTHRLGAPLTRAYCNLALFRMREPGPYEEQLYQWIRQQKGGDLIRFRPMVPRAQRFKESPFELTPEESSRLLIESYQALADRHDDRGIDALLEALKTGKPKNHPLIGGLLLRAIQ